MSEALETIIGVSLFVAIPLAITNTMQFANAMAEYSKIKEEHPDNYQKIINKHYKNVKKKMTGYYADQKQFALPGIALAKYIVNR